MMKKVIGTLLALLIISFTSWNVFFRAEANELYGACSPDMMTQIFNTKIENHKDVFFLKDADKKSSGSDSYNLQPYIDSLYSEFNAYSTNEEMKNAYHEKQSLLFELAIKQSLQGMEKSIDFAQKSSSTRVMPVWSAQLSNKNQYPFAALYTDKFQAGDEENPKVIPTFPTLIVGLESALNYAVFSCSYKKQFEELQGATSSLQEGVLKKEVDGTKIAADLLAAKRVMDYALNAYDGLAVAYPQHVAYLELIEELRLLREQFGALEEVASSCVFPNRFNASCKK